MTRIAFLGAGGIMGLPMARHAADAGLQVRAWNRTREKAEPLTEHGVELLDDPAAAAEGAEILVTMLSDAAAVEETVDAELLGSLAGGAVWAQMSTIGEEGTERCASLAEEAGVDYVDAPVLGTRQPAEAGEVLVLASGAEDRRGDLAPLFDAVGRKTMWVGEAGAGTRLKLVSNNWVLSVVEATAETIALAEGLGIDPGLFLEAVEGGPLDLPYLRAKGKAMMERSFQPSFTLALAAKDAGLLEAAAEERGLDLPVVRAVRERFDAAAAAGHGDEDMAATFRLSAPR